MIAPTPASLLAELQAAAPSLDPTPNSQAQTILRAVATVLAAHVGATDIATVVASVEQAEVAQLETALTRGSASA